MKTLSLSIVLASSTLLACSDEPANEPNCEGGRCDFGDMLDLIRTDKISVPVAKLVEQGVPAFDKLACNDVVARLVTNEVDAHSGEDLSALVAGLSDKYGNNDLSIRVNEIRRDHLDRTSDRAYLEADASFDTGLDTSFSYAAGGYGGAVKVGFDGGVGYRFVSAMDDTPSGLLEKNLPDTLQEICDSRDFLIPQSMADLAAMTEGDLVALHGNGSLGINLGLNVPILIGDPVSFATYNVVLNAGYSQRLEGEIDTQVIRLDNNTVVLDVGIKDARIRESLLRLSDQWGVQSFCGEGAKVDCDFEVFGKNLSDVVDDGVKKMLNKKVNVLEAAFEKTNEKYRMSVARMKIDLNLATGPEVETAVLQAMVGDLRLMQALAYREEQGINVEFDLLRSGVNATSSIGVEVFGASVFKREVIAQKGDVNIQTPGGFTSIFFDNFHKSGGWGSSDRGYTRVGVGGIKYAEGVEPRGDANLIIQIMQSHGSLNADKLLDHLDGILIGIVGLDGLETIEARGNDLMRQIDEQCDRFDTDKPNRTLCTEEVFAENPQILVDIENASTSDLAQASSGLADSQKEMVQEVAYARFAAQACFLARRYGPEGTVVTDFRLDDKALEYITQPNRSGEFADNVHAYLGASEIRRYRTDFLEQRSEVLSEEYSKLNEMTERFDEFSARYRAMGELERESLKRFGSPAIEIQLSGAEATNGADELVVNSMAEGRARAAARLFDELRDAGDGLFADLGPKAEFTVAYGLLGMTPDESVDLRIDTDFGTNKAIYQDVCNYGEGFDQTAKGSDVAPIQAGNFSLDDLVGLEITRSADPEDPDA